jgi:hypothetical protein
MSFRGRDCPLAYRYPPEALAVPAVLSASTLYVVGGLYGNPAALQAVLQRARREPASEATIMFNGDFHWLDIDPQDFRSISELVLSHHAIKGNVEAELASKEDAGCGCAYPDYVDDAVVERSNQIMDRLKATADRFPDLVDRLGKLPRHLTAGVGGERIGIVHGDPESLAGWRLALEAMEPGDAAVREQQRLVINNGSAGLGNFAGSSHGVITRLSSDPRPPQDSLYGITIGGLRCDAIPVRFDPAGWRARFLAQWPPGSPGYQSYFQRIKGGTSLLPEQAARGRVKRRTDGTAPGYREFQSWQLA